MIIETDNPWCYLKINQIKLNKDEELIIDENLKYIITEFEKVEATDKKDGTKTYGFDVLLKSCKFANNRWWIRDYKIMIDSEHKINYLDNENIFTVDNNGIFPDFVDNLFDNNILFESQEFVKHYKNWHSNLNQDFILIG